MATQSTHPKLLDESPLLVFPSLACSLGLNESIFVQQLHFWLKQSKHEHDGERWVYNTYAQWQEQFPFWTERIIRSLVVSLESLGIIISTDQYNRVKVDRTKWYRIDYKVLRAVLAADATTDNSEEPGDEKGMTNQQFSSPLDVTKNVTSVPETTQRLSTETTNTLKRERVERLREEFERFWLLYPNKSNKKTARNAWLKLNPNDELIEVLAVRVGVHSMSDQWQRGVIPHASTWLNGERWNDELPAAREAKKTPEEISNEEWAKMAEERGLKPNRAEREGRIQVDDAYETQWSYAE